MKFNFAKLFTGWMSKGCPESIDTAEIAAIAGSDAETVENLESEIVATTEKTIVPDLSPSAVDAALDATRAELEKGRADLRKMQLETYEMQAEAYLSLHGDKITPAEHANLKSAYVGAAMLDRESPVEGFSVLASVKAGVESRAPHKATAEVFRGDAAEVAEHLSDKGLKTLGNSYAAEPDADAEFEALMASTEEGRAILASRKAK